MFFKRFFTLSILILLASKAFAGVAPPPASLPSEQDSILQDCISNGSSLGLSNIEIDSICPATSNGLQWTVKRTNQGIDSFSNNLPFNSGSAGSTDPDRDEQTLGSLLYGDQAGMNAGSWMNSVNVWGSANSSDSEYTLVPIESDTGSAMIGAHTNLNDSSIIGISFGISGTTVNTIYNSGEQDLTDYTVAGYVGSMLTNNISVGANGGYSFRNIDQFRTGVGGTTPFTINEIVNGDTESDTWFVSASIDGFWQLDSFIFGAHSSLMYSEEDVDSFTETGVTSGATAQVGSQSIETGQFRLGVDVGYTYPGYFEPYVGLTYINYFEQDDISVLSSTSTDDDDSEFIWTAGLRFFNDSGVTGSVSYSKNFSRDFLDYDSLDVLFSLDL